ncbi:MAG: hypothetical protein HY914_06725 [Desulfomonile tiedjei]|nr:hypothetical protein [Desulfomonile tiedjei]
MSGEPSPFSTGGGGTAFEWLVATTYVISLLSGHTARGLPGTGTVVEVRLQQRGRGYPVDDIVVIAVAGTTQMRLILQAKHALTFTVNDLFCKTILDCWNQFNLELFKKTKDFVGIAISESCYISKIRTDFQELLTWARKLSQNGFYEQVSKFKAKQKALDVFRDALALGLGRKPGVKKLWEFLRHLMILSFDLESPGGRDSVVSWNMLRNLCRNDATRSASLFKGVFELVSRYSKAGGEIDLGTVKRELQDILPLAVYSNVRTAKASLVKQVVDQLNREKQSKKYIPEVFTEIHTVKESVRVFSHPVLFTQKLVQEFDRTDFSFVNRILSRIRVPLVSSALPQESYGPHSLLSSPRLFEILETHVQTLTKALARMDRRSQREFAQGVPQETTHIFEESRFLLAQAAEALNGRLHHVLRRHLLASKARVFILTSRAGQGKTNFVCDFCETFLLRHRIPAMLIPVREFRSTSVDQLDARLVELALGKEFVGSLKDFLGLVGEICEENGTPFIIIIDGLNEHPDIPSFSESLEDLVNEMLEVPFVKVVLTCRSEYYDERFRNLAAASFADQIFHVREINEKMSSWARDQMKMAYLSHFKIRPTFMSPRVSETLGSDPLLLRFFCEAYGDPEARQHIQLGYMPDIYRPEIFEKYLEKKLHEVATRNQSDRGLEIGRYEAYKQLLRDLVKTMVDRRQFSDFPISDLDQRHHRALAELIDEDVFFRRDLSQGKSVLDPGREVINLTFDEFRDFLLADHLIYTVWGHVSHDDFTERVRELTSHQSPVAEGLSRYLFYADRTSKDETLHTVIEGMPWYEGVFLECIFAVRDRDVKDKDVQKIQRAFGRNSTITGQIVHRLMERWETDLTPTLNIDLLFEMVEALNNDDYNRFIRPIFEVRYGYNNPSQLMELVSDIRKLVNPKKNHWDLHYAKLIELLIFIFPIRDGHTHPAFDAFHDFAQQNPDTGISLLEKYLCTNLSEVRTRVWEMLAELGQFGITMPQTLVQRAHVRLSEVASATNREGREIQRFIRFCSDRGNSDPQGVTEGHRQPGGENDCSRH